MDDPDSERMKKPEIDIGRIFHALGDPTRRAIVEKLSERPHSVSSLAGPLNITLTAVGQHLQLLEESGSVRTEKTGRVRPAVSNRRASLLSSVGSRIAARLGNEGSTA